MKPSRWDKVRPREPEPGEHLKRDDITDVVSVGTPHPSVDKEDNTTIVVADEQHDVTELPFPELPAAHLFNRLTDFPRSPHDPKHGHNITPADVKAIADRYAQSELDPDTGRIMTLVKCCQCQDFSISCYISRVHAFDEVEEYHQRACVLRAEALADSLLTDATNEDRDIIESEGLGGTIQQRGNNAAVRRDELIVKTKQAVMGYLNRDKYAPADRVDHRHAHLHGVAGGKHRLDMSDVDNLSLDDLLHRHDSLHALPSPSK